MGLLGALELTALRSAAESAMPGTVVIWRTTRTSDGSGGRATSVTAAGTVACRAVPQKSQPETGAFGSREEERQRWYLYLPAGTDVRPQTDSLVLSGGGTFEVLGVHGPRAYEPSRRVLAVERT